MRARLPSATARQRQALLSGPRDPEGGAELTDWFPKYAVTQVAAIDRPPGPWLHTSTGTWGLVTAIKTWTQTATVHNPTIHGTYIHCVLAGENTVLVQNVKPGQNAI